MKSISLKDKKMNKYRIETSGKTCHYQIANLKDNEVNEIDLGEMGYGEIEEKFLWDKTVIENRKLIFDTQIQFRIYDEENNVILEFSSNEIDQRAEDGVVFCPEPKFNNDFQNTLCYFDIWKGSGPIYEFETKVKLKADDFSYTLFTFDSEEDVLFFINDLYFKNNKIEETDFGETWGDSSWIRVFKNDGSNFLV
ncbi:hypothetical protein N9S69_00495 [Flavobacteriaceae bacterium]|nr:hypothetical protein [Flavobacteriaceae bacterium]